MFVETRRGLFYRGCATAYIRLKGAYQGLGPVLRPLWKFANECAFEPIEVTVMACATMRSRLASKPGFFNGST
jgi:hypothetical protein